MNDADSLIRTSRDSCDPLFRAEIARRLILLHRRYNRWRNSAFGTALVVMVGVPAILHFVDVVIPFDIFQIVYALIGCCLLFFITQRLFLKCPACARKIPLRLQINPRSLGYRGNLLYEWYLPISCMRCGLGLRSTNPDYALSVYRGIPRTEMSRESQNGK
jgi:hypothetical protein